VWNAADWSRSFKHRNPPDIHGTGYVVESLKAALWAFYRSTSFRDAALLAINLGDDADVTADAQRRLASYSRATPAAPTDNSR
jgi:ADP-ribosyl-[dinitrogen reductase] hydrolase